MLAVPWSADCHSKLLVLAEQEQIQKLDFLEPVVALVFSEEKISLLSTKGKVEMTVQMQAKV